MAKKRLETINERLYVEVARELGLPLKTVKDYLVNGQSKFTAFTMSDNTFNGIRWPFYGVFKVKHRAVQMLNYMKGMEPGQRQFFRDMARLEKFKRRQKRLKEKQEAELKRKQQTE